MELNQFIDYLVKLREEGKGNFVVKAHNIRLNEANGGDYYVDENTKLAEYMINVDNTKKEITLGNYEENFSY